MKKEENTYHCLIKFMFGGDLLNAELAIGAKTAGQAIDIAHKEIRRKHIGPLFVKKSVVRTVEQLEEDEG